MSEEIKPKSALESNILAVKTMSNLLKSTLGPKGKDKLLVNKDGKMERWIRGFKEIAWRLCGIERYK